MTRVTVEDTRKLGYCASGLRIFFKRYELDYSDFVFNGIDASELLLKTDNNIMALKAVEAANERE